MQDLLFALGLILFLLGLLTGLAIPALKNPRMGLAGHMVGMTNGPFLIV
ncbi:MAG: hab, partial [Aeromicrobium sp.]|nr:hab [Aeromicrobium sp.]